MFDGSTEILVEVTADELEPDTRTALLTIQHNESDLELVASRTFSFEVDEEGWTAESGTFVRTTGSGANGTNAHMSSSSGHDEQCDIARSPSIVLTDTSTMTLRIRYDIELQSGGQYWDRANISVRDASSGERTVIVPSSGRPYSVPNGAGNGVCGTGGPGGMERRDAELPEPLVRRELQRRLASTPAASSRTSSRSFRSTTAPTSSKSAKASTSIR